MTDRQELLILYAEELKKSLPTRTVNYYGRIDTIYLHAKDLIKNIEQLNVNDKIVLAQLLGDDESIDYFKSKLDTGQEQIIKYNELYKINRDIDKTLNPEFLNNRYDFLIKRREILSTDIGIQQQIIGLSDERLEIFKMLYEKLEKETKYSIPYISNVLAMLSDYRYDMKRQKVDDITEKYGGVLEELSGMIKTGETITDEDLTNLLFLSQAVGVSFNVDSVKGLRELSYIADEERESVLSTLDEEEKKKNPDIDRIKGVVLINVYGLHPQIASDILKSFDIEGIAVDEKNKEIIEIYNAIRNIMSEEDPKLLMRVIRESLPNLQFSNNYAKVYKLENELRTMFAREYNSKIYSPNGMPDKLQGAIPVYYADDKFKMMVTSIGAYQVGLRIRNYKDYWNSPRILSHMNCCSMIANNNLSMADVKKTIFGFSSFDEHMLLLSGVKDLNSTPLSKDMHGTAIGKRIRYMNPDKMIDHTRTDYNEIVYERRDLAENALEFKKQPDYVLFIKEFIDEEKYLDHYENAYAIGADYETYPHIQFKIEEQEKLYNEAFRAAQDLGIPVVVVNREKCIRNQKSEINNALREFEKTQNPDLISKMITEFENARASLGKDHLLLQNLYFSDSDMQALLSVIESVIESKRYGSPERKSLKLAYYKALKLENAKYKNSNSVSKSRGQTTAINYKQVKESLERL